MEGTTSSAIELAGLGAGVPFALASIALVKVGKNGETGRAVTTAGWPYAAVWTIALAARMAFVHGSSHWFHSAVAQSRPRTTSPPQPTAPSSSSWS